MCQDSQQYIIALKGNALIIGLLTFITLVILFSCTSDECKNVAFIMIMSITCMNIMLLIGSIIYIIRFSIIRTVMVRPIMIAPPTEISVSR